MKKAFAVLAALVVVGVGWWVFRQQASVNSGDRPAGHTGAFDKTQQHLDQADSMWVVVNKRRPLQPADYEPASLTAPDMPLRLSSDTPEMWLRSDAAEALSGMAKAAKASAGLELQLSSGYRSYDYQRGLYDRYVRQQGQAEADTQSARPGHSEHQTGLAADIEPASRECEIEACFADLPEGKWVAANAYKYGFVVRYVGKPLAAELHKQGNPLLETFFGLPPAPDYGS
jgi:D-alanyl-D-alanine carboxypeptidase